MRIARRGDQRIVRSNDRRMDAVPRLHVRSAGGDDIELERLHVDKLARATGGDIDAAQDTRATHKCETVRDLPNAR